jgi:hypothetical protein
MVVGAVVGALAGYIPQVVHNMNDRGMSLGAALTTDINAMPIINGAAAGALIVPGVAVALSAASQAATGAGVALGNSALVSAGQDLAAVQERYEHAVFGASMSRVPTTRDPNEIGRLGVERAQEAVGLVPEQIRADGGERIWDGWYQDWVSEVKASTSDIVYPNSHVGLQIAFDAQVSPRPTWLFVGPTPSESYQTLLQDNGIPWLGIPW